MSDRWPGDGRVVFLQPYVPVYRKAFFGGLAHRLAHHGLTLEVLAGVPQTVRQRADAVEAPWARTAPGWELRLGPRRLRCKHLDWHDLEWPTLLVSELAAGSVETLRLLSSPRWRHRTAVWGHVGAYTTGPDPVRDGVRRWQMQRARHVFAYTAGGAEVAAAAGVPAERVTVVQNSCDTSGLTHAMEQVEDDEVAQYAAEHHLDTDEVAVFIGALDSSKRLPFLLAAGGRIARRRPDFRLAVAGTGPLEPQLAAAAAELPWLRPLGRAEHREKALLSRIGRVMVMPGRVGLVAVDAFVMGLPMVTTRWPLHAPEVEYLSDGVNARVAPDGLAAFASTVEELLTDDRGRAELARGCAEAARRYTLEAMVERFTDGLLRATDASVRV